jgi:AcrR family transcriptional regulator
MGAAAPIVPDAEADVMRRAPFGHPVIGERGAQARRRILAGALAALGDAGFDDLRVELITRRAGCSRPTFYQYFSSKHDVFFALARQLGGEMVALAGTLRDVTPDSRGLANLTTWVSAFMDLHDRWAPVFAGFPAASVGRRGVVPASQPFSSKTAAALAEAFGLADQPRQQTMMIGMVAVLMRASFYAELAPRSLNLEPFVRALAELFHRMFCGPIDGVNLHGAGPVSRRRIHVVPPAPRPRTPLGPKAEKARQRLLDTALAVLRARGFRETAVDDITAAAHVSHGTFYRYFANMEELVQALAEMAGERTRVLLGELRLDLDEPAMRAWLRTWFASYAGHGGIISVWQERPSNAALSAYSHWVAAWIFARLSALLQCRGFGDAAADATVFLALLERLPHTVFTLGFLSQDEGIDTALLAIRRGLLAIPR